MAKNEVDAYLAECPEPQRSTLQALRTSIKKLLPNAEETIYYGVPAYKVEGKGVAGFASFKKHCSYFPMSGSVFSQLENELAAFVTTKGALHFPIDKPLSLTLVNKLITTRLAEIPSKGR